MSRHERWGSLCHFCEESCPCETVTLRDENAKRREQADALAEVARQARDVLNEWVTEDGGCDHAVGICNCSIYNLIGDIDTALRAYKEARDE